ncbi:MAG: hypothetical protein K2O24_08945 [Muribaculaceae bacterium]|nr:hypothetical protein [Muribaculaceae bacterium]
MIRSKKELEFYMLADRMMNRGRFKPTLKDRLRDVVFPDYIMRYLRSMRVSSYLFRESERNEPDSPRQDSPGLLMWIKGVYHSIRYRRLGVKLGYSIGRHSLGYGVVLSHYGTIVVGETNRIGRYAVLHTSTCVSDNGKTIGDAFYLATGAKVVGGVNLGDNVTVGANAVVSRPCEEGNCLLTGIPASAQKKAGAWYEGLEPYAERVEKIEALRKQMNLD